MNRLEYIDEICKEVCIPVIERSLSFSFYIIDFYYFVYNYCRDYRRRLLEYRLERKSTKQRSVITRFNSNKMWSFYQKKKEKIISKNFIKKENIKSKV